MPNEELLEAERRRVRDEYEKEMVDIRQKFQTEQQSKAKMQEEVSFWIRFDKNRFVVRWPQCRLICINRH